MSFTKKATELLYQQTDFYRPVKNLKKFLRNMILKEKASSEKFVNYLKKQGVNIGSNVKFYSPSNTLIDVSAPYLLSIGDNVRITHGVIILTHDYSWSVLKLYEDEAFYNMLAKNSRALYEEKHSLYSFGINVGKVLMN